MQRFNFGNQVTNGMQILSNAATAARAEFDASNALNNMTYEERKAYGQARAKALNEQSRQINNNANPMYNMTNEEQRAYGAAGAVAMNERTRRVENSVDPISRLTDDEQDRYGEARAKAIKRTFNEEENGEQDSELLDMDEYFDGIGSKQMNSIRYAVQGRLDYMEGYANKFGYDLPWNKYDDKKIMR